MNIVQIGDKLRDLPISILHSEDIVLILGKVNDLVPDEDHITASSTGNDLYRLFNSVDADVQTAMLEDIFKSRRESIILNTIIEEATKKSKKENNTGYKWTSVQGSIVMLGTAALIMIIWSFISEYGTKPAVPDAVVGNLITELLQTAVELMINYFTAEQ